VIAWVIVAVVAVPVLLIGFFAMRRKKAVDEYPADKIAADREAKEFEEAERYEAEWREEQHKHHDDTLIP
jgi:hypothetical protein